MLPSNTSCTNSSDDTESDHSKRVGTEVVKDQKYWERRKRNNIAAKKSRDKSRQQDSDLRNRVFVLENVNALLRRELKNIKLEYKIPQDQVFLTVADIEECSRKVTKLKSPVIFKSKAGALFCEPMTLKQEFLGDLDQTEQDKYKSYDTSHNFETDVSINEPNISYSQRSISNTNNEWRTETVRQEDYSLSDESYQYHYLLQSDDECISTDSDVSINKKRKVDNEHGAVSALLNCDDETPTYGMQREANLRTVSEANLRTEATNENVFPKKENLQKGFEDAVTVWDLTGDDDSDSDNVKDDLKSKLQNLSDQIEVMQRLVDQENSDLK